MSEETSSAPRDQTMNCQVDIDVQATGYDQLTLVNQCCCEMCAFYLKAPDCIGCAQSGVVLCCNSGCQCYLSTELGALFRTHSKGFCFDISECKEKGCVQSRWADVSAEGDCLFCFKWVSEVDCGMPTTCCKVYEQCFCIDVRCACPTDSDLPCGCALCGFYLYGALPTQNWGSAKGASGGDSAAAEKSAGPAEENMNEAEAPKAEAEPAQAGYGGQAS